MGIIPLETIIPRETVETLGRTDAGDFVPAAPGEGLRPAGIDDHLINFGEDVPASDPASGKLTPMEQTTVIASKTHHTTVEGDTVTVHDLQLFVGYDPDLDGEDDERIMGYDEDRIAEVVARTQAMMAIGQNPKLILGHNTGGDEVRPAIGDIVTVRVDPDNPLLIRGDVEMAQGAFDTTLGNNAFPRRSAEIWSDGQLSEVALLGSQTPARPIADTKYRRAGMTREMFTRTMPPPGRASGAITYERAKYDLENATDPADVERFGRIYEPLLRKHIAGLPGIHQHDAGRYGRARKDRSNMYGQDASFDQEILDAVKQVNLRLAAKFARRNGIADAQFDRAVVTGCDRFGKEVTTTFGEELEDHQRKTIAAEGAEAWCRLEGKQTTEHFKAKYEELLRG